MLELKMKSKIEGRRGIGRKQGSCLKTICDWTRVLSAEQKKDRLATSGDSNMVREEEKEKEGEGEEEKEGEERKE